MPGNFNTSHAAKHETLGQQSTTSRGTTITASASANTKGTYTNVGGVTSFAYEAITVHVDNISATSRDFTVDIGIAVGGGSFVLVADARISVGNAAASPEATDVFYFPVHVPAGAQLTVRCQSSTGSSTFDVTITGHSTGIRGAPGFARCLALYTPSTSRGVQVDPGDTANTKGAWAAVNTTSVRVGGVSLFYGNNGDFSATTEVFTLVDIAIGPSGSECPVITDLMMTRSVNAPDFTPQSCGPFPVDWPAGTEISARAQSNATATGSKMLDIAILGFVP